MINLLKAELYKLQKSRSFWVSGGLIVLFAVSIYLFYVLLRDGMINGMDQEGAVIQGELPALGILDILRQICQQECGYLCHDLCKSFCTWRL